MHPLLLFPPRLLDLPNFTSEPGQLKQIFENEAP